MNAELLRAVVVDDEPLAMGMIEGYVKKTPFLELAGSFSSAAEALEVLRGGGVDVAFLDIQMPDLSGLELSRLVSTKIVFITAFDKYAVEGFKVGAADYLLKPVTYADFLKAAGRVRERVELERAAESSSPAVADSSAANGPAAIFVKSDRKLQQVEFSSVEYIESDRDYVIIHTAGGGKVTSQMTLKSIEELLPASTFVRVRRSFIVNIDKVRLIEQNCIVFDKALIPITSAYHDHFFEMLSRCAVMG